MMDFLNYLWGPILGAVIGYFTNYIAVKMLFRPYKPWKIGRFTVPFTPGIVPKRKDALAKAVGNAVGHRLFTGDDLKELLLSDDTKNKMVNIAMDALDLSIAFTPVDEPLQSANSLALTYLGKEQWENSKERVTSVLADRLLAAAKDINLGEIIAKQGAAAITEKKGAIGGMIAMFINENTLNAIIPTFAEKIDAYIDENGKELIYGAVKKQLDEYTARPLHDILTYTDEVQIRKVITVVYEKLINAVGKRFNEFLDIAATVENKVAAMDPRELEDLCLSVMKKELSAVINLGAVIGFILGIFNLVI